MIKELSSDLKNLLMMRTNKVKKNPELSCLCFVIDLCVNNRYFNEEKRGRIAQKGGQKKKKFYGGYRFCCSVTVALWVISSGLEPGISHSILMVKTSLDTSLQLVKMRYKFFCWITARNSMWDLKINIMYQSYLFWKTVIRVLTHVYCSKWP